MNERDEEEPVNLFQSAEEWAAECGRRYGLEAEVREWYHKGLKQGLSPEEAAWAACYEWDV